MPATKWNKPENAVQRKRRFCSTRRGRSSSHKLSDVYYWADISWNMLSFEKIEERSYDLRYDGRTHSMVRRSNGFKIFDVDKDNNNVLMVRVLTEDVVGLGARKAEDCILAALAESVNTTIPDSQAGSQLDCHLRFAHLAYETIERMANDPESGIILTNKERPAFITCAQGKQTRNKQSIKDTGMNAPIDRVGGIICSDIKGPINPIDRWVNSNLLIS